MKPQALAALHPLHAPAVLLLAAVVAAVGLGRETELLRLVHQWVLSWADAANRQARLSPLFRKECGYFVYRALTSPLLCLAAVSRKWLGWRKVPVQPRPR
jgi:hypothetical protein